jgi:hypothetical protein
MDIESAKTQRDEKVGERKTLLTDLRNRFGLKTKEEAEQRSNELHDDIRELNTEIDKLFDQVGDFLNTTELNIKVGQMELKRRTIPK